MGYKELLSSIDCKFVVIIEDDFKQIEYKKERALYDITRMAIDDRRQYLSEIETVSPVLHEILSKFLSLFDKCLIRYNNFRKLKSKQKKTWFAALW